MTVRTTPCPPPPSQSPLFAPPPISRRPVLTALAPSLKTKAPRPRISSRLLLTPPKDFIQAAIDSTVQEVKTVLDKSGTIGKAVANEPHQKMAVQDCQDLMQFAIDELQASISAVGDSVHTITDREAELRNWLGAVVSYHEACLDGCDDHPEPKNSMSNGLLNATQLTSNALAIVSTMADILKSFNIPVNTSTVASWRLLDATDEVGKDGYPAWLSAADRKLLVSNNPQIVPNAVVAKDGSGQYKTVAAAIAAYPKHDILYM